MRKDQYQVTVKVDGIGELGIFDSMTGGENDSDEQKYRPGAMQAPISLGGATTMGNVTLERLCDKDRDWPVLHALLAAAGTAAIEARKQPMDNNKVPFGRPLVYSGVLKTVTPPEHDSTSSDPSTVVLEFVPSGIVG
jgi:hypothetical protein